MNSKKIKLFALSLFLVPLTSVSGTAMDNMDVSESKAGAVERTIPVVVEDKDSRLASILGHAPTPSEYAFDARLEGILRHPSTPTDYANYARLRNLIGHAPSGMEYWECIRLEGIIGQFPSAEEFNTSIRLLSQNKCQATIAEINAALSQR